ERLVRAIADNRRDLLPYRDRFPELGRIVKDPWRTGPVEIDIATALDHLPEKETVSVRIDPELTVAIEADGILGRPRMKKGRIEFTYRRKQTGEVEGPRERLELLGRLLEGRKRILASDLKSMHLPRDLEAFKRAVEMERGEVQDLVAAGRSLVEAAERVVCRLYRIPRELEDEIVEHGIARADA
ncbi:MAG: hypothetical protein ACRDL1_06270, partial [Solirubrobacterales bacterium]